MTEEHPPLDTALLRAEEHAVEDAIIDLLSEWIVDPDDGEEPTHEWVAETLHGSPERRWGRIRGLANLAHRTLAPTGILDSDEWNEYKIGLDFERRNLEWDAQEGYRLAFTLIDTIQILPESPSFWGSYIYATAPETRIEATLKGLLYTLFTTLSSIAEGAAEARDERG